MKPAKRQSVPSSHKQESRQESRQEFRQEKLRKILNIPNAMSLFRIFLVPWFVYLLLSENPFWQWAAVVLFVIASLTDFFDGYWARKYGHETNLGKHLDAMADKILVIGALLTFVSLNAQVELWMVLCILSRDLVITFLRYLAYEKGNVLRTTQFAKVKTAFQMLSITVILTSFLLLTIRERAVINQIYSQQPMEASFQIAIENMLRFVSKVMAGSISSTGNIIFEMATFAPYFLLFFTSIVTVVSGVQYLILNRSLFYSSRKL